MNQHFPHAESQGRPSPRYGRLRGLLVPLMLLLAAVLTACGSSGGTKPPAITPAGSLEITIAGLPAGTDAGVTVSGPDGFSSTVTAGKLLEELKPGTYTVAAAAVNGYVVVGQASHKVEVTAGKRATVEVKYTQAEVARLGKLKVIVGGLASGAAADISVAGPSYSANLQGTAELINLEPGTYTVTARAVAGHTIAGAPEQAVEVKAGDETTVTVTYTAAAATRLGSLNVTVEGLRSAGAGNVTVSGPDGFSNQLTDSAELKNLVPGSYTVTANPAAGHVLAGNAEATVDVRAAEQARATVGYIHAAVSVSADRPSLELPFHTAGELDLTISRSGEFTGPAIFTVAGPHGLDIIPNSGTVTASETSFTITVSDSGLPLGTQFLTVTVTGEAHGQPVSGQELISVSTVPVVTRSDDAVPAEPGMLRHVLGDERSEGQVISFSGELLAGAPLTVNLVRQLDFRHDVTFAGPTGWTVNQGPRVILDGQDSITPVVVFDGARVTLSNITIRRGNGTAGEHQDGGGVKLYSSSSLTLDAVHVHANRAARDGGGIWSTGVLTLENDTRIFGNRAGRHGGGVYFGNGTVEVDGSKILTNHAGHSGGGVYSEATSATLRILNQSEISGNEAVKASGGIHSWAAATISDSFIRDNQTDGSGGGIRNHNRMDIDNTIISGNTAAMHQGGILNHYVMTISDSTVKGNTAGGNAGGIANGFADREALPDGTPAELIVERTVISNNRAGTAAGGGDGGGIWSVRRLTVTDSAITGNSATGDPGSGRGGGIFAVSVPHTNAPRNDGGTLTVNRTTLSHNTATDSGGGIYSGTEFTANSNATPNAPFMLLNSTVAHNKAEFGAGISTSGFNDGPVSLYFNTIARNEARGTGATGGGVSNGRENMRIFANIIGFNISDSGGDGRDFYPSQGSVISAGYNFFTVTPHSDLQRHPTDVTAVTPAARTALGLQPLGANGGFGETMAVPTASWTHGKVPAARCTDPVGDPLLVDQRKQGRPVGTHCGSGAFQAR